LSSEPGVESLQPRVSGHCEMARGPRGIQRLLRGWAGSDLFALLMLLYTLVLGWYFGFRVSFAPVYAWHVLGILYGATVLLGLPYIGISILAEDRRLIRLHGRGASLSQTCRSLLSRYEPGRHAWELIRVVFVLHLVLVLHSNLHRRVPHINAHLYDEAFRQVDRAMFLGVDPVEFMTHNSFFSSDAFCAFIDQTYVMWYAIKFVVVGYFFFQPDLRELRRFATAFVLMWAIHMPVVLLWPTLGPAFIHPQWFEPLNLPRAQEIQAMLWEAYQRAASDPQAQVQQFEGISGFYSLHVGLVGMYAMFLWRHSRIIASVMWLYTLIIFVGSGLTGWHYLCDGVAGVAVGWLAFAVARRFYPLKRRPLAEGESLTTRQANELLEPRGLLASRPENGPPIGDAFKTRR
jgi:hypothetical protein